MGEGDTIVNAVLGALATIVLSGMIPFSPIVGGAMAGYLEGGTRSDGTRIGLFSGVIAAIPTIGVIAVVFSLFTTVLLGSGEFGVSFAFGGLFVVFAVFAMVYVVGFSALGGWVGNYVKHDTDIDI